MVWVGNGSQLRRNKSEVCCQIHSWAGHDAGVSRESGPLSGCRAGPAPAVNYLVGGCLCSIPHSGGLPTTIACTVEVWMGIGGDEQFYCPEVKEALRDSARGDPNLIRRNWLSQSIVMKLSWNEVNLNREWKHLLGLGTGNEGMVRHDS